MILNAHTKSTFSPKILHSFFLKSMSIVMYYVNGPLSLVQSGSIVLHSAGYNVRCEIVSDMPNSYTELFNIMDIIRKIRTEKSNSLNEEILLAVIE